MPLLSDDDCHYMSAADYAIHSSAAFAAAAVCCRFRCCFDVAMLISSRLRHDAAVADAAMLPMPMLLYFRCSLYLRLPLLMLPRHFMLSRCC